jgi:hypothetical protein
MTVKQPNRRLGLRLMCVLSVLLAVATTAFYLTPAASPRAAVESAPSALPLLNAAPAESAQSRQRVVTAYGNLPLAFEANQGQTDPRVKYMARGNGYTLFLTSSEAVVSLPVVNEAAPNSSRERSRRHLSSQKISSAVLRMQMVGANPHPQIAGQERLPGISNYFIGNDPHKWQTGVPQYGRVGYQDVYPGVNLAFHGEQRQLEFDFIVAAGADPAPIGLHFAGADRVTTDEAGSLILSSSGSDLRLHKPVAYQEKDGSRQLVDAHFVVKDDNRVAFALGEYDRGRELVIDPSLIYSTYLGGSGEDEATAIAIDSSGNAYLTGRTNSLNFPGTVGGTTGFDVFVSKVNAAGSALSYSTIIGGNGLDDVGLGIAVNSTGVYVVGSTSSTNYPLATILGPTGAHGQDAFVAKLNLVTGVVTHTTLIGGGGTEEGNAIAINSSGNAYIVGQTDSTGTSSFPTQGPIQGTNAGLVDAFIAELNTAGTGLVYSTYLGGSTGDLATGIALDGSNNAYVTGITVSSNFPTKAGAFQSSFGGGSEDSFVAKIMPDGSALVYSTFLGGNGADDALAIAVDSAGEVYVTGKTQSTDFPTLNAFQPSFGGGTIDGDGFVTKLNATGSGLIFSTYLGGSSDDTGTGIALDSFDDPYTTGRTLSTNFPTGGSPFQVGNDGGADAFVTELSNTGYLVYSSYLGGTSNENSFGGSASQGALGAVAVDSTSRAYLAGATISTIGFPTQSPIQANSGGGLNDAFVTKVGAAPTDFSVSVSPSSVTVTQGSSAAYTVSVRSVNSAFGSAVTLSCGGLPAHAACGFTPPSPTPGAAGTTSNLRISTQGPTAQLAPSSGVFYAMLLPVSGLALMGAGFGSRKRKVLGIVLGCMMFAGLILLPACGGSGGGGGGGSGTPRGTYTVTVTGMSGSSHSTTVTLKVQ